ncbi:MAG TPA: MFS transporter [Rhizomicrobium sp.]|jgi:Na+/melibiose symporter-like transporter
MADAPAKSELTSLRTKLFYGFGSVAYGVKDNGFQTILLPFYNLVLHLPAQLVGLAIAIAFIFDALLDPIVGQISDNLRTRWGRRHPLMYLSAPLVAISYLLLWNPPHWSDGALFYYLIACAVVVRTFITFYEIPSSALIAELTPEYDQRTSFSSFRVLFAWCGGLGMLMLALFVLFKPTAEYKVGQLNPAGYSVYGYVAAIVMFIAILVSAAGTHRFIKYFRSPPKRQLTLAQFVREMVGTLLNRAFLILMAAVVILNLATGLVFALNFYIATFFWGLTSQQIGFLTFSTVIAVLGSFVIAPPLSRLLNKRNGAIWMFSVGLTIAITPLTLGLLGVGLHPGMAGLIPILFAFNAISAALTIGSSVLVVAMIADVVEDSELKTGRRSEGLFFAGNSLLQKAVTGLGVFASGMLLWATHFPTTAVPGNVDPAIVHHFAVVYLVVVVALYAIGIFIIGFFPITRETHRTNLNRLAAELTATGAVDHPPGQQV